MCDHLSRKDVNMKDQAVYAYSFENNYRLTNISMCVCVRLRERNRSSTGDYISNLTRNTGPRISKGCVNVCTHMSAHWFRR